MPEEHSSAPPGGPSGTPPFDYRATPKPTTGVARQFMGLFVVPLMVVIMCVSVFVLFGWVAYDRNSVDDYLNDLRDTRSVFAHRRKQAAYELSKILSADADALRGKPAAVAELRRLFRTSEDDWVRVYLASVLGHLEDREAVPLLVEACSDDNSQVRIYSLMALGSIGESSSMTVVRAALRDEDAGIRKTAAFALGAYEDPSAVDDLLVAVEDPVAEVRWNAALSLAHIGSAGGAEVLLQMLDRRLLAQIPDITPAQQEAAMIGALRAIARLGAVEDLTLVDGLARQDPSLKVRQAAIETRRSLSDKD